MYKLHYVDKLRTDKISSALVFGKAIDKAIEALLTDSADPFKVFEDMWYSQEINGKQVVIADSSDIEYFKSDLDITLLDIDMMAKLDERKPRSVSGIREALTWINQAPFKKVPDELYDYQRYASYLSLTVKGKLIIEAYKRDIKPRIAEVIAMQKEINLEDGSGNKVVGYIDLIARLDDGRVVVIDNKTAGQPYKEDAVEHSQQLALYSYAIEDEIPHDACGYAVVLKKPKKESKKVCLACDTPNDSSHKTCAEKVEGKRCGGEFSLEITHYAETQFLISKIPDNVKAMVVDNFNQVSKAIKAEVYPKNLDKCTDYFGSSCPYYEKCWHNNDAGFKKD
jgi:hypothetical protein